MRSRCQVTYSRTRCKPFVLGVEGLKCELEAGHDSDEHVGRYTIAFTPEGGDLEHAELRFKIVSEEP